MLYKTPSLQSAAAESLADFEIDCHVMAEPVRGAMKQGIAGAASC